MPPSVPLQLLRNIEYRHFITARFFYIMAIRTVTTVVGWKIYELTRDPFAIGLLGLSEFCQLSAWHCMPGTLLTRVIKGRLY